MLKENYEEFFCIKLAQFRTQKNISARKMSLDLGYSDSYINKIENGRCLPGMNAFFQICYYLDIEPKSFFDDGVDNPIMIDTVVKSFTQLTSEQQQRMIAVMNDILKLK